MEFGDRQRKVLQVESNTAKEESPVGESLTTGSAKREGRAELPAPSAENNQVALADLLVKGQGLVATGITRTFLPEEIGQGVGFDACGQFHRINHGELEFRSQGAEWEMVDPYSDPGDVSHISDFSNIHDLAEAITGYICQRVALEGESAMVPEPESPGSDLPELDYLTLLKANVDVVAALRTMPELKPVTKRSDWEKCEDGTLQPLVFDALTLHDVLTVLGPMAEALARRIEANKEKGLEVPAMDSRPLDDYRRLLADSLPAAEKLSAWVNR